jgi:ATP-dependent RNA helicase DDX10/DBP4
MKSIYLQKDRNTFDLSQYPAEEFAASMGLPGAPQIKFGNGNQKPKEKKRGGEEAVVVEVEEEEVGRDVVASDDEESDEEEVDDDEISGSEGEGEGGLEIGSGSESDDENIPTVRLVVYSKSKC